MDNIIECRLNSTCKEIFAGLWQHDYGQILRITGADLPKAVEVQFSLKDKGGDTLTRIGTTVDGATEVKVPDSLLKNENCTQNYLIYAWIYVTDDTSGNTEYKIILHVKSRSKPEKPTEEPLPEPNIFHETVEAVNVSAERAEKAASDAENIRDNLNLDLSEKITRPDTAKVGQVLAVKEIDESGKPTVFEAEDVKVPTKTSELENDSGFLTEHQDISGKLDTEKLPEAIDTALAQAKESGVFDGKDGANGKDGTPGEQGPKGEPGETTYIENPYDDTELKSEIATKITAPENPEVGKAFKIKSVNDDGTFIGEWADCTNLDVRINGESIVRDGVAEIPVAGYTSPTQIQRTGLVHVPSGYGISFQYNTPNLIISNPPTNLIDNRNNMWQADYYALTVKRIDYAVKSAMCDGKGATWTAEEQAAARERMGIDEWESILDITLEEESSFSADFEHEYKKLYIYIDQSGVSEKIHSPIYCCPYSAVNADNKKLNSFHSCYAATTNAFFNISAYWESYGSITKRIMNTTNNQNETTGNAQAYIKSWDTSVCNRVGIGKSFKGIYPSLTIFKPGTKIVIKGVRA